MIILTAHIPRVTSTGIHMNLRMIRSLCPIHRGDVESSDISKCTPDVSNREINAILRQVCVEKGHHITFIQDASNGEIIRDQTSEMRNVGSLHSGYFVRMLGAADDTVRRLPIFHETPSIWVPHRKEDSTSHVVLAAAETGKYTYEREVGHTGFRDIFTHSLVCALRSGKLGKASTFRDLICCSGFPYTGQTAVVSGKHKNVSVWYQK